MKYALNHRHAFLEYKKAALMGFLQAFITLGVETVNMLVILQSDTTQDVVFNFIAVAIISDFDNFVFSSLRNEPLKELVDDNNNSEFLKVSFTTSNSAKSFDEGGEAAKDVVDDYGEPVCMKINFWKDRSLFNKFMFLVYRLMRTFFTSVYFYFYPPLSIMLGFLLPMMFQQAYKNSWVTISFQAADPKGEPPSP